MESYRRTRERNLVELAQIVGVDDAIALQAISRSLHTLDESACNCGLTGRQEKRSARLESKAKLIADGHGLLAYHQGDPRGWSLYIVNPERLGGYDIDAVYDRGMAVCPH